MPKQTYVKCRACKETMRPGLVTCTANTHVDFPRGIKQMETLPVSEEKVCHDCGVKEGGKHHPGCDMERCPKCKGQLIMCGHLDSEEDRADASEEDIAILKANGCLPED